MRKYLNGYFLFNLLFIASAAFYGGMGKRLEEALTEKLRLQRLLLQYQLLQALTAKVEPKSPLPLQEEGDSDGRH